MLFWSAGIMLIINQNYLIIVAGLLLLRLLVTSIIIKIAMNRLNEKKIFLLSLVYDLFSPIFTGALLLANRLTQKPRKWN
jgi:hypothetical protein